MCWYNAVCIVTLILFLPITHSGRVIDVWRALNARYFLTPEVGKTILPKNAETESKALLTSENFWEVYSPNFLSDFSCR